jgi:hypothetical protein
VRRKRGITDWSIQNPKPFRFTKNHPFAPLRHARCRLAGGRINGKEISFLAPTITAKPKSIKIACLIQDTCCVELKNVIAARESGSCITADLADQNISLNIGNASLVIDGEEFSGNVVRHTDSQVIFESDRFEEIAKKLP